MATLKIEMDDECIECPSISLVTSTVYGSDGNVLKIHDCMHADFCRAVRKAWEAARKRKEASHER